MNKTLARSAASLAALAMMAGTWTSTASAHHALRAVSAAPPLPAVPQSIVNASKKFKGQPVVLYGLNFGIELDTVKALAQKFSQATGIKATIQPVPASATDAYASIVRQLDAHSSAIDVYSLDVI